VVRAWPGPGSAPVQIGDKCYRQLYDRDSPCDGCPVGRLGEAAGSTATDVVVHPTQRRLDVVHATRLETGGPVRVTTWPVDEALLGRLFGARVQWLSAEKGLSAREHAVLELLLMGRSAAEIAVVLDISPRTAKYHQRNVQRKLGAESRQDLLRVVL
jgi:DNA-binding CsgD family transcriptional regulator